MDSATFTPRARVTRAPLLRRMARRQSGSALAKLHERFLAKGY